REGLRRRRRCPQRRCGGHHHLHAVRHGLPFPLRSLERSRVPRDGAGILLRPRAREPDLPVEQVPLQRAGDRLQQPGGPADRPPPLAHPRLARGPRGVPPLPPPSGGGASGRPPPPPLSPPAPAPPPPAPAPGAPPRGSNPDAAGSHAPPPRQRRRLPRARPRR